MSDKKILYILGNIYSVILGWVVGREYGWQLGWLTYYVVCVLVDIRKEVTNGPL